MRIGRTPLHTLVPRLLRAAALLLVLGGTAALMPSPSLAEDLAIGLGAEVTSLDPHFHNLTPNRIVGHHVFDALTLPDEYKWPAPGLAVRWSPVDGVGWDFVLRRNVTFHDGTPFTAADAAASLKRALAVQDSPYPYAALLRTVTDAVALNDHTLRIRTSAPDPTIPAAVGQIAVIPARFADATRADFDSGRAMVGTGPFRFAGNRGLSDLFLAANPSYWGGRPRWDRVTLRILPEAGERVAALTAGTVQIIDQVPPSDIARLKADPQITVRGGLAMRLIYLALDLGRERSPHVTDRNGAPLARNPLKDPRVRRAISKAINRQGTVDLLLEGLGAPAGQFLPRGVFGSSPALKPDGYDPDGAKRLLAEAGWPDGFSLTLHAPNNRYANDAAIARTLGVALSRIGIATRVETLPAAEFFSRAARLEFSAYMSGITTDLGETADILLSLVATFDADRNRGRINRMRYSNPALDDILDRAGMTLDLKARERLLREATEMAMADAAVLPLYFEGKAWAMHRRYSYAPRSDEYTLATEVEMKRPSAAN